MTEDCQQWRLSDWLSQLESRHSQEIQLGLDRVETLAQKLNLKSWSCPVITVAGTNGKGSTVAALEAIYTASGYRVASYTSPHLFTFNERIRFCREMISDEALCLALRQIEAVRGELALTYFETITLAALWYFKQQQPDLLILEVGLGGRLDATNVVDADVAVITTIDYDHQEFLGETLEAIAYEKAGIMRREHPVILADYDMPDSVLTRATELAAPVYHLGKAFDFQSERKGWRFYSGQQALYCIHPLRLPPKSIAAALMTTELLKTRLPLDESVVEATVSSLGLAGRMQILQDQPFTLLADVAHNPQAALYLANHLKAQYPGRRIHALFSALRDKDLFGLIEPLKDCVMHWYPAQLEVKRAASRQELLDIFKRLELEIAGFYPSPALALQVITANAQPGDLVVVYGSFYTLANCLASYQTSKTPYLDFDLNSSSLELKEKQ